MKLSEYIALCKSGKEIPVWDRVYDMETYFYNDPIEDDFGKAVNLIAQSVDVVEFYEGGVTVDFWGAVEKARQRLIDEGFYPEGSSMEYLMNDVHPIISGCLSEAATLEYAQIIYKAVTESKE